MVSRRLSLILFSILFLTLSCSLITQRRMPPGRDFAEKLTGMLSTADPGASWSVEIRDLGDNATLFQYNSSRSLIPASNVKLFTTAAALEALGPDFRYKTVLLTEGTVDSNRVLRGDLIIAGEGDPSFSGNYDFEDPDAVMADWAERLSGMGISRIGGGIIVHDTLYGGNRMPNSWEWGDLNYSFAVPVSPLNFNDNCYEVSIYADSSDSVIVKIYPENSPLDYEADISIDSSSKSKVNWFKRGEDLFRFDGSVSLSDTIILRIPAERPEQLFLDAFGAGLLNYGIEYSPEAGEKDTDSLSFISDSLKVLLEHESAPLVQIVEATNRESVNLYAESILRILGIKFKGDASAKSSLSAADSILSCMGLNTDSFRLADGSGLSRHNWIPAAAVNDLLKYVYDSDFSECFINALPAFGEGTLESRALSIDAGEGWKDDIFTVRAKTGSMTGVRALSGYVLSDDRNFSFSFICNNYACPSRQIEAVMEGILEHVIETAMDGPPRGGFYRGAAHHEG